MRRFIRTVMTLAEVVDLFWLTLGLGWAIIFKVLFLIAHFLLVLGLTVSTLPSFPIAILILAIGGTSFLHALRAFLRDLFERERDEAFAPIDYNRVDDVSRSGPNDHFYL